MSYSVSFSRHNVEVLLNGSVAAKSHFHLDEGTFATIFKQLCSLSNKKVIFCPRLVPQFEVADVEQTLSELKLLTEDMHAKQAAYLVHASQYFSLPSATRATRQGDIPPSTL